MSSTARLAVGLVLALCAALALGATDAGSSTTIRPAPGAPDPKLIVLTSADLRGAKVTQQGYYKDADFPSVISYGRELEGGRFGSTPLVFVSSDAEVGTSAATTTRFLAQIRRIFGTRAFRDALAESFADEFDVELATKVQVGRPRALGVGGGFDLPIVIRVIGLRMDVHVAVFRVERVLGAVTAVGEPGRRLSVATMARMASVMSARMTTQLTPRNTAAPVVSGTPSVGQTLTATTGTWAGAAPVVYAYAWERCDAAGMGCTPIAGANAAAYVVQPADAGSTLRVTVTAQNGAGSASAPSAATAVIPVPGAPVNTAPPTIAGTAAAGQTLTASVGTWSGSPTSFAFQWLRCNASGSSCVPVAGATGQTYAVGAADVTFTLRVVVTATNAAGSAPASSAQTSVVT